MATFDPPGGPAGPEPDDLPVGNDPAPGRRLAFAYAAAPCKHCRRAILLGPVVCPECMAKGFCSVCGDRHRAWQCPEVVKVRLEMAAAEQAAYRQSIRDHANALLAQYKANPIEVAA